MKAWSFLVSLLCLVLPAGSWAEVIAAAPTGFSLRIEIPNRGTPRQAYDTFVDIGSWWDPAHSYSGDAANLSLQLQPGGAFLESLAEGGFVKHLEVVYVVPGQEIRLLGGLGPLQPMGLHGALSVQFVPTDSGSKTIMIYHVTGFSGTGLENLAPVVDKVQQGQMQRHADLVDRQVSD